MRFVHFARDESHAARGRFRHMIAVTATVTVFASVSSCTLFLPPTATPLPSKWIERSRTTDDAVILLLPGRGDRAETFVETDFTEASVGAGYDLVAVDAHVGYYAERTLLPRLHEDIVAAARQRGYSEIWLLGVSLGGLGSVLYAADHPAAVDGIILLAPYLGDACIADRIQAAGGLKTWSGDAECAEDFELDAWHWLQRNVASDATEIILGYGTDDRLARGYRPLSDTLPASQVHTLPGGHDWTTWTDLWTRIGEAGQLPQASR